MLILYIVALLITPTAFCAYPLHDAVCRGDTSDVKALIAAGADVNEIDQYSLTPLHHAAYQGNIDATAALIAAGADVNKTDHYGNTPLLNAIYGKNIDVITALIVAGANVNATTKIGRYTPLYDAACQGNIDATAALIAAGADVNATTKDGQTPLKGLVESNGNINVVEALIAAGAEVNARNNDGKTPLYNAADGSAWRKTPTIETLLTAGARLDEKSLELLGSNMPELLPLACAHNPANLRFLRLLTRDHKFNPEQLKQVQEQCTKIQHDRLAAFYKEHGVRNPIALLKNQRRGRRLAPPQRLPLKIAPSAPF